MTYGFYTYDHARVGLSAEADVRRNSDCFLVSDLVPNLVLRFGMYRGTSYGTSYSSSWRTQEPIFGNSYSLLGTYTETFKIFFVLISFCRILYYILKHNPVPDLVYLQILTFKEYSVPDLVYSRDPILQ